MQLDNRKKQNPVEDLIIITINIDTPDIIELGNILDRREGKSNFPSRSECLRHALRNFLVTFLSRNNITEETKEIKFIPSVDFESRKEYAKKQIRLGYGYRTANKMVRQKFGKGIGAETYKKLKNELKDLQEIVEHKGKIYYIQG